jgi:hypothetical protein
LNPRGTLGCEVLGRGELFDRCEVTPCEFDRLTGSKGSPKTGKERDSNGKKQPNIRQIREVLHWPMKLPWLEGAGKE